jgi:hypothetical protein
MNKLRIITLLTLSFVSISSHAAGNFEALRNYCAALPIKHTTTRISCPDHYHLMVEFETPPTLKHIGIAPLISKAAIQENAQNLIQAAIRTTTNNPSADPSALATALMVNDYHQYARGAFSESPSLHDGAVGIYTFAALSNLLTKFINTCDLNPRARAFVDTYTNPTIQLLRKELAELYSHGSAMAKQSTLSLNVMDGETVGQVAVDIPPVENPAMKALLQQAAQNTILVKLVPRKAQRE